MRAMKITYETLGSVFAQNSGRKKLIKKVCYEKQKLKLYNRLVYNNRYLQKSGNLNPVWLNIHLFTESAKYNRVRRKMIWAKF